MEREQAIKTLEHAFGFKLPKDKLAIIKYNHKTTSEINSCAGAGKTTLILFDIFLCILTGVKPYSILDVTFSKKAQMDIVNKYNQMLSKLNSMGLSLNLSSQPNFSTFHALFYHLLRIFPQYKHVNVLTSYTKFTYQLSKAIKSESKALSTVTELRNIFKHYAFLVNNNYTFDGLVMTNNYFKYIPKANQAKVNGDNRLIPCSENAKLVNYIPVIEKYNELKQHNHMIDFSDMQTLLLRKMTNPKNKAIVKQAMSRYHYCYLDEFQDIDNLQWTLISHSISPIAKQRLMVIGDDDQSIYSFRGSNPSIIIDFTKNYPKTKLFHLSTNYRTNGNVLKTVKPMITKNKYRIHKKLLAGHSIPGGTFEFMNCADTPSNEALLDSVFIKQAHIKNPNQIAILCRFNSDRMIVVDWLANHNIYIRQQHTLADNSIYKVYYSVIASLGTNNIYPMFKYLRKIGFNAYQQHIKSVMHYLPALRRYHLNHHSKYAKLSPNNLGLVMHDAILYDTHNNLLKQQSGKIDKQILDAVRNVHKKHLHDDTQGQIAFDCTSDITNRYFHFMLSNKYMSKSNFMSITNYIADEIYSYYHVTDWLNDERKKHTTFNQANHDYVYHSPFNVLTIHQSKGLQFRYVFIYNLTDRNLHLADMNTEHYCSPHMSRQDFITQMIKLSPGQIQGMDDDGRDEMHLTSTAFTDLNHALTTFRKTFKTFNQRLKKQKHAKPLSFKHLVQQLIQNKFPGVDFTRKDHLKHPVKLQTEFNLAYDGARQITAHVEEERRLLYVAITRAQQVAVINYSNEHHSPLLDELKIDKKHKFVENADGKFVPYKNHDK